MSVVHGVARFYVLGVCCVQLEIAHPVFLEMTVLVCSQTSENIVRVDTWLERNRW